MTREVMRRFAVVVASFAWVGAGAAGAVEDASEDASAVVAAFDAYKAAILGNAGSAAADLVTPSTIDYFGEMQQLALFAAPDEVRAQSLANQLQILTFRHRIAADALRETSARDVFVYAVDRGWVGKNSAAPLEAGEVRLSDGVAAVEILQQGSPTGLQYRFERIEGSWRIDLVPVLAMSDRALKMLARQQDLDEETLILSLLESTSGRPVPAAIWEPLFPKPGAAG